MQYKIKLEQSTYLDLIFQAERLGLNPDELANTAISQFTRFLSTKDTPRELESPSLDGRISLGGK